MEKEQVKLSVKLTGADLYKYNLYHTYRNSTNGAVSILLGLACLLYGIGFAGALPTSNMVILIGLGILFWVYNPVSLWMRSQNRFLNNAVLKDTLDYCFDEKGMTLTQGDVSETVAWDSIYKVMETKSYYYIYLTRIHANIIPKSIVGEQKENFVALLKQNIKKGNLK